MQNNDKHFREFLENSYYQIHVQVTLQLQSIVIITLTTNQHAYQTQAKQIYKHY